MINPYSSKVCQAALALDDRLHGIVDKRLKKIDRKHHDKLREAAGYLVLERQYSLASWGIRQDRKNRRKLVDGLAKDHLVMLQDAGIVPVPSLWMIAVQLFIRFVVLPFLRDVLDDYTLEIET